MEMETAALRPDVSPRNFDVASASWNAPTNLLLYLDDIIVIAQISHPHAMLRRGLSEATPAPSKAKAHQKEVGYLVHIVSISGLSTDPEKKSCSL